MSVSNAPDFANSTDQAYQAPLSPDHIQYLSDRAVDPDWAVAAGVRAVTAEEAARALGFRGRLASGGLLIPYPNAPDFARVRLDDGKPRFLTPEGKQVPIYLPPGFQAEPTKPLLIVEGPIKALALHDHGFKAVGLGGVSTTLKQAALNVSWEAIDLRGREVVILFDAGRANNGDVARAEARLAIALERASARVKVAALPLRDDGRDQGPDDFLKAHGSRALEKVVDAAVPAAPERRVEGISDQGALDLLSDLPFLVSVDERGVAPQKKVGHTLIKHGIKAQELRLAINEVKSKAKRQETTSVAEAPIVYAVRDGAMSLVRPGGAGEGARPICNFAAEIVHDELRDDGATKTRTLVLEGKLVDGTPLPRVRLSAEDLGRETWLIEKWGSRAILYPELQRAPAHLRAAIQTLSAPTSIVTYLHTGFRERDGTWVYLHSDGAVGAAGIQVELEALLARFRLPPFPDDPAQAVKQSLEFLEIADGRITLPLHCAVYRAPLLELLGCDSAIAIVGKTGSLKSSVVAVAQSHWGEFDHAHLPLSWNSTANAIALHLHRAKDVMIALDDFVARSSDPSDEQHKRAAVVFRAIGNGSARSRLRQDCTAREEHHCRALVVSTGEDLPRGESVNARLVAIRMKLEDVNVKKLTQLQAKQHRLPHAMLAYIEWLRTRMTSIRAEIQKKFVEFRNELAQSHGHLRAPAAMAHLLLGAHYFCEFAKDIGVMNDEEASTHVARAREALLANHGEQLSTTDQVNPAHRFMDVLRDLITRNKVFLGRRGMPLTKRSNGSEPIGWKDDKFAYVLREAAISAVSEALRKQNDALPLQQYGLIQRLVEEGFAIPDGKGSTRKETVSPGAARPRVIKMRLAVLLGSEDPDDDPDGGAAPDDGEPEGGVGIPATGARPSTPSPPNAQEPGSIRARSGRNGEQPESLKQESIPLDQLISNDESPLSAQEPRSLGGERSRKESEGPSAAPQLALVARPTLRPWASGHADAAATAILKAGRVGIAIRSTGPNPLRDRPRLISVNVPDHRGYVLDCVVDDVRPLLRALENVTIVGHELKPSLMALQHHFGFVAKTVFDSAIALRVLDSGVHLHAPDYFSFANASRRLLGRDLPGAEGVKWGGLLPSAARTVVAKEAQVALQLERSLGACLAEEDLLRVAEIEFNLLPVVVDIDLNGVPIDRARWEWVLNMYAAEARSLRESLERSLQIDNINDNGRVLMALRRLGIETGETNSEALAPFMAMSVVKDLVRYRSINSFVVGAGPSVLQALGRSIDERVRGTINQIGAKTGRMSMEEPNLLGLPRERLIRGCVEASPGKTLVRADYNQIEFRVLAAHTNDTTLKAIFASDGGDCHRHTAAEMLGVPEGEVTGEQRSKAKPVNFGTAFGMGTKRLISYGRKNYNVELSAEEAEHFRMKFLGTYKGIAAWQEGTSKGVYPEPRTGAGRRCRAFDSDGDYNARLAFPIQGTAADGMKRALVLMHPRLRNLGAKIVLVVHDEVIVEIEHEYADEAARIMEDSMVAGMKEYLGEVPVVVQPQHAKTWGQ